MMTPDEIEAREKRQAAVHEAGHAVIAFFNGVFRSACLYKTETKDAMAIKTWIGRCQVHDSIDLDTAAVIGIAGIVAECVAEEPEISAAGICDYWDMDIVEPSPTDLELMPASWGKRLEAVEEALKTISEHRVFFESVVSDLVENDVSDGRMDELARQHL